MADTFRYVRSTSIAAEPARVASFIHDFHAWARWSPWEKLDADLQRSYSGAEKGVGARYAWAGKKAGTGNMLITGDTPARITLALNFEKPFKAENVAEFELTAEGKGTRVTWSMSGKKNLMSKVFGLFMNMDELVGKDFEAGLANLKALAEAP